jgi:5-formyltetrahydrofolate cyclo-ligase
VGLAFDVQIIDMVPADERDMSVDIVVTDRRVTHAARTRSRR